MPKLFRLAEDGRVLDDLFAGITINTPSLLCVEDFLDALRWAEATGGLKALQARADANAAVLYDWIASTPWIANLAVDPKTRSNTSVCLRFTDIRGGAAEERRIADRMVALLAAEGAAHDLGAYRTAPPGLRIWCGVTVEKSDLQALTPWLDWAYAQARAGAD